MLVDFGKLTGNALSSPATDVGVHVGPHESGSDDLGGGALPRMSNTMEVVEYCFAV